MSRHSSGLAPSSLIVCAAVGGMEVSVKLRYQLRGLGIGMVLAALLMGVATGEGTSMSDAEIKARALELGMVESDSLKLTDIVPTQMPDAMGGQLPNAGAVPTEVPSSNSGAVPTEVPSSNSGAAPTEVPSSNSGAVPTQSPEGNDGVMPTQMPSSNLGEVSTQIPSSNSDNASTQVLSSNSGEDDTITIVIEQGEIASEICAKLKEAGAIEDAAAFETFLCERDWCKRIRDGIYHIPLGTSMEDIAGIITRKP